MFKVFTFICVFQQSKWDIDLISLFIYTTDVSTGLQIKKKKKQIGIVADIASVIWSSL